MLIAADRQSLSHYSSSTPRSDYYSVICCVADINAGSRFVAETTEANAAVFVGVVALILLAIPICLFIVIDITTFVNPNTSRKNLRKLHRGRRHHFKLVGDQL